MSSPATRSHDVVVVGGRCAGASAARLLAERGWDVLVADRAALPSDTLSTHGIARGGVVQLARWGLLDAVLESGAPAVRKATFGQPGAVVTRPIKPKAGVDLLVAPRRAVLDALLADEARAAGATFTTKAAVKDVVRERSRVVGVALRDGDGRESEVRARLVIGADGMRSTISKLVAAPVVEAFSADVSLYYAYVADVPWDAFEFHAGEQAYAGAFPTHGGEACVWLSRPTPLLDSVRTAGSERASAFLSALDATAPDLASRARAGRVASPVRGCVRPPNFIRQAHGPGWALVGDAGCHRDPITGHGITDAFRDAELLADAAHSALAGEESEACALASYQAARDEAIADVFRITRSMAAFPSVGRFVDLQLQLAEALEREAEQLAAVARATAGSRRATAA